ncbi:MAG TPA: AAA family ATPase [Ramlibacter sp.]|nr:AAA family ATPase [Ramlibacter sp.]
MHQSATSLIVRLRLPSGDTVLHKEPLGPKAAERLGHESAILGRLAGIEGVPQLSTLPHPATVLALEDFTGVVLSQAVRHDPLGTAELLALAVQLAHTIAAVHRRGVLHLNISPAHVLLCGPERRPILIDFHRAVALAAGQPPNAPTRDIPGDLAYVAPEQTGRGGRAVDQRADLYSLGATLYEAATGSPPFEADDPLQLIHDHLARLPVSPIARKPGLPRMLSQIIMHLLEKEPDRRYQSAEGLACDIERLQQAQTRGDNETFPLGERDFPLRLSPPVRLVSRQREITVLRQALEDAIEGNGRVALVAGAPGVGKTSLVNELRPMVIARGGWFVSGKFDQYQTDAPTAAVQALRVLGRLLLAEPQAQLLELRARILAHVGPNAALIPSTLPEFALLLGVPSEAPSGDPALLEARLRLAIQEMLRAIASPARPLVMVLDDLQWSGTPTIWFVDNVRQNHNLRGLLVVGTYREGEVGVDNPLSAMLPRWKQDGLAPLELKNLPPAGLGELLREMLRMPRAQAAALAQAVGERTGGNPFDSVELVNALRHDGVLVPTSDGWQWDGAAIHRHIGQGDVIDLVRARIAQLPAPGREVLEAVACLGVEVRLDLLGAALGLSKAETQERLAAPLEAGLLLAVDNDSAVQMRHDRVQQAAYGALAPTRRGSLHLALARRLALRPEWSSAAAQQYLAAVDEVREREECTRVAALLHQAAIRVRRTANYAPVERMLAAAATLLVRGGAPDEQQLATLEIERHAVLYSLGRLEEADLVYRAIEARGGDVLALVRAACVQVDSLSNRNRPREAVALGLSLLRQLGLDVPHHIQASDVERRMDSLDRWANAYDPAIDGARPETVDPRVVAAAQLINRLQAPAFFCDMKIVAWLVLESQRLWAEHGPCAALVANLSRAMLVSISVRQDYRTGYQAVRHVLAMSEARGYEPETSQARHLFAISTGHWFEPLENCIAQAQRAREGTLLGGDLQSACFTYRTSIAGLLECAPTLDSYAAEIDAGQSFAARTGNAQATAVNLADRQLLRALRGQTDAPGTFDEGQFNEATHLGGLEAHPMALVTFHIRRALAAALFGDAATLLAHAARAMPLLSFIEGFYPTALAHLLQALALAEQARGAPPEQRDGAIAALDEQRQWLAQRAADAPANFLHWLRWIEAERAWALGDFRGGARIFDAAMREAQARQRPWHQALITERAGLFHLAQGMERTGEMLLARARRHYDAWGASAKVQQLERTHGFLRTLDAQGHSLEPGRSGSLSADAVDTLAVLRASQALSSETSLARLEARVVELLGTLTGATTVQFARWSEDAQDWLLSRIEEAPVAIEEAGRRGLVPLSAFRYAERTREPLVVEDATRDDRFSRDPYVASLQYCSLLIVPILNHGDLRAVLLLENRLSRGAFLGDRLDAVVLIAGQLAVSLENALLYEKLEQRVREQTQELREAQAELVAAARVAGMAEIATNVLHNVGNILNSVNVSADLVSNTLRASSAEGLSRAVELLNEHGADLGEFLTRDERGRRLPGYLAAITKALAEEQRGMTEELRRLTRSVDHIKEVVATQQSYAMPSTFTQSVRVSDLIEDALRLNRDALARGQFKVVKAFAPVPVVQLDRARVLQILVNLISNAANAMEGAPPGSNRLTLEVAMAGDTCIRVSVRDQGVGIPAENLTRIFAHGFTTRRAGHGFGLHSCALAARQLGGTLTAHSDGVGHGATFVLELPVDTQGKP